MPAIADLLSSLDALWAVAEARLLDFPELAGLGAALALAAALMCVVWLLRAMVGATRAAGRAAKAASIKRSDTVGARILIARGRGVRGGQVSDFLGASARTHLQDFMFGGPFSVIDFPAKLKSPQAAEALLERAGADLVLWGDVSGKSRIAWMASRQPGIGEDTPPPRRLDMPKSKANWTEVFSQAMAYAAARQMRPALARPQNFRSERLEPVVKALESVLADDPDMDDALRTEIVDDFAAGALQLAFAGDDVWLGRSLDVARETLAMVNRGSAPDRWVAAKINLGRALKLRCERRFDPVMLQEAVEHLTDALEALRTETKFKRAEAAAQAITEAQNMLSARRRFSISSGGL